MEEEPRPPRLLVAGCPPVGERRALEARKRRVPESHFEARRGVRPAGSGGGPGGGFVRRPPGTRLGRRVGRNGPGHPEEGAVGELRHRFQARQEAQRGAPVVVEAFRRPRAEPQHQGALRGGGEEGAEAGLRGWPRARRRGRGGPRLLPFRLPGPVAGGGLPEGQVADPAPPLPGVVERDPVDRGQVGEDHFRLGVLPEGGQRLDPVPGSGVVAPVERQVGGIRPGDGPRLGSRLPGDPEGERRGQEDREPGRRAGAGSVEDPVAGEVPEAAPLPLGGEEPVEGEGDRDDEGQEGDLEVPGLEIDLGEGSRRRERRRERQPAAAEERRRLPAAPAPVALTVSGPTVGGPAGGGPTVAGPTVAGPPRGEDRDEGGGEQRRQERRGVPLESQPAHRAPDEVEQEVRQETAHRRGLAAAEAVGEPEIAEVPQRRRPDPDEGRREEPPRPGSRRLLPPEQRRDRHRGDDGDPQGPGQERQGGGNGGQRPRRPAALPEVVVRAEEGQRREEDEEHLRERPPGQVGERQRQGEDQRRPSREEPGFQVPAEIPPGDEDRQAEERRVQRPGHPERVEDAETAGGEQQRVERRPEGVGGPVVVQQSLPGEQVPGDGQVVDAVPVEGRAVGDLPRQHQRRPERRDPDQEECVTVPTIGPVAAGGRRGGPAPRPARERAGPLFAVAAAGKTPGRLRLGRHRRRLPP